MNKTRSLLFRLGTVLVLVGICAWMMIVGRGHTVYLDNKKLEYEGETYEPPYKITVFVKDEQVAKLNKKDRGMATTIGQHFRMTLRIMQEKKGEETEETYDIKLPYNLDGIVINLPGFLAGLPEDAWMSEFVSLATTVEEETEEVPGTDEFTMDELGDF
jgi:hypothetical protein